MQLYAVCTLSTPHMLHAFIKSDNPDTLLANNICLPVSSTSGLEYGMVWNGSEFIPDPAIAAAEAAAAEAAARIWPISSAQAKLALYNAGLLDAVTAAVAASYPPMKIFFDNASEWHREHPYVLGLAAELGLSDSQVDALFRAAAIL